jgi:hypothetical protein
MEDAMTTKRVLSALTGLVFLGMVSVSAAQAPTGEMMGKHTMDGQVTKVDAKKGWVDVKTPEGSMKLHFPPAALANVKKGDSVTVELSLKDNGPAPSRSDKK